MVRGFWFAVGLVGVAGACNSSDADGPTASTSTSTEAVSGEPRKLADLEGEDRVVLHLWVSNQSLDPAEVDIQLWLDGVHVAGGDFAVEGQHNYYEFPIEVPRGPHELRARALSGELQLKRTIDVPDERFGYLDYWYYPDEEDAPSLNWTLSAEFVPFQ
jgi:hypothetical protein